MVNKEKQNVPNAMRDKMVAGTVNAGLYAGMLLTGV